MTRADDLRRAAERLDLERAERREQARDVALALEHALHRQQHRLRLGARQREWAPRPPQADADLRFIRTLSADVADEHVNVAVLALHEVEEVTAEQRAAAPGAVARGHPQ